MPDKNIHIGDKSIQATGDVDVTSSGGSTTVAANGMMGNLMLLGTKLACMQSGSGFLNISNSGPGSSDVALQTGPAGSISIGLGPMEMGARMKLSPGEIEIAVGPPGVGASIKMTPVSIELKVAENTLELTPAGLSESIASVTTRSATPAGHVLKSAESSYELSPMGEAVKVPTSSLKPMTTGQSQAGAMCSVEGSAQGGLKGAIVMIN